MVYEKAVELSYELPKPNIEIGSKNRQLVINSLSFFYRLFKRAFDICISCVCLALLFPLFAAISYIIWLDSPGAIFYKQLRIGLDRRNCSRRKPNKRELDDRRRSTNFGMPFYIYKFRTMHIGAEEGVGPVLAEQDDPRITRIGKWLRKTRLDELPQFWNVLKGNMSIVGPRPERPYFVNYYQSEIPEYAYRLSVKPGLTGLAQIYNGYDESIESVRRKIVYDLAYINMANMVTDLKLILRTVPVVLRGEGAH